MIDWDLSDLTRLHADLGRVPGRVVPATAAVVAKGASNIVRDARRFAAGNRHAPLFPRSITFDMSPRGFTRGAIEAEIGPDKNLPQGALGNLLEFGSKNNAPHPSLLPAAALEAPRTERNLADAAEGLFE